VLDIVRKVSGTGRSSVVGATKNHRRRTLTLPMMAATTVERWWSKRRGLRRFLTWGTGIDRRHSSVSGG
jgi:hypothetical protein